MSDIEEPAAKITKLDNQEVAEGEEMDNGQEEWLSEDILTDDDYNPAADNEQSDSHANTSQEEGNTDSLDQASQDAPNGTGENIERTLNDLESATPSVQSDLPEELGPFLIRKTDGRVIDQQQTKDLESDLDEGTKQSEDDGNDTDDLLRMLGDDSSKKKETSNVQSSQSVRSKVMAHSSDDDDDDYIFEGARVTRMRVSKDLLRGKENNVKKLRVVKGAYVQKLTPSRAVPEDTSDREADNDVIGRSSNELTVSKLKAVKLDSRDVLRSRRLASKAVAEDLSDPDEDSVQKHPTANKKRATSSDEAMTVKRMFGVHQAKMLNAGPRSLANRRKGINAVKTVTKRVISIEPKNGPTVALPNPSRPPVKSTMKLPVKPPVMFSNSINSKSPALASDTSAVLEKSADQEDMSDEEHLNDDLHDIDSDEDEQGGQRLMRPERMDEEVPTDAESHTDDDSYYDEMPLSESEDADDWFTLDIRAERAAEYIPLLGEDAKALLMAEQERAAARLGALQRSADALVEGRRSLAAQLRVARSSLAKLDAALAQ